MQKTWWKTHGFSVWKTIYLNGGGTLHIELFSFMMVASADTLTWQTGKSLNVYSKISYKCYKWSMASIAMLVYWRVPKGFP